MGRGPGARPAPRFQIRERAPVARPARGRPRPKPEGPMNDSFRKHTRSLTSPPEHGVAVVPGDADLGHVTRALYVGGGGDLAVRLQDGTEFVLANVPTGTLLPIRVARVLPGTSATQIVGLW